MSKYKTEKITRHATNRLADARTVMSRKNSKKKVPFKLLALRNLKKTQQLLGHDQAKTKKCTI